MPSRWAKQEVRTDVVGDGIELDVQNLTRARFQVVILHGDLASATIAAKQSCDPKGSVYAQPTTPTTLTAAGITDSFDVTGAAKIKIEITVATATAGSRAMLYVCAYGEP